MLRFNMEGQRLKSFKWSNHFWSFEPDENQPHMMSSQESWHLVDECVISPLHSSLEVTPEDSVSRVSQVDSGRSRALSSSTTSSSSSKRRRDAKIKAAIANLQAKQLAERVKRDNEVREQEFQEEMAQKELEWKLECRKRELDLLRRKREDEMAVISAQNQAEVAQLEHEILGQESSEGKAPSDEISKVSKSSPSLKHYVVPSPKVITEVESKDRHLKGNVYTDSSLDRQAVSYGYSPFCTISKSVPIKNLEFHEAHSNSLTLGSAQAPVAKRNESDVLTFSTAVQSPYSPQSKYSLQTSATPISLAAEPLLHKDLSSPGYVSVSQPKPLAYPCDNSNTTALPTTSVTWSSCLGLSGDIPSTVRPLVGDNNVILGSTSVGSSPDYLACTPHKPNSTAPFNHPQPSYVHVTQWAPATRSTSTPYFGGPSTNHSQSLRVEEPVDAFIDKLREGQETAFQLTFTSLQTDSSVALLRAQEQQRLPPLELFKFTGKPIEWPKFIERFRDQIHNKTTLTDSDRMAYLFQNLDGEAKKAVESLGVTGHSYPAALKTLKRQFGNPNSVATAYLSDMLNSSYVPSNDRQAMRDYYYQVKACTTWCVKMGQSAILQTPEYLSKATMKLPMNLRVRWYEYIDGRSDRSTLVEFEKWLRKRVETLFNPLEDFICEEWNKKQRVPKSKPSFKLNPLATKTETSSGALSNSHDLSYAKQDQSQSPNKVQEMKTLSSEKKCVICKHKHPVAFCPVFKSKNTQERRKIAWDNELCFNCLKTNHQARNCPSVKRCLKERCGLPHHTLLHEDHQLDPHASLTSNRSSSTQPSATPQGNVRSLETVSSSLPTVQSNINQVCVQPQRKVLLQVLPVQIHSQGNLVSTYAVLDPGSDSTLIRKDLADRLQLVGKTYRLNINTVGNETATQNLDRVSFGLSSKDQPDPVMVHGAWVIDKLNIPCFKVSKERVAQHWNHLSDVDLPELDGGDVMILIGADMAHLLIHLEVRQGRWDEPIAVKTPLGWTLFGNVDQGHCETINANFLASDKEITLQHQIERFWEIDSYATEQVLSESTLSVEDRRALAILESSTVKEEGHYKTALLWKREPALPNNRAMAVSRLHSTERKLKRIPELAEKYQNVINDYVTKGYAQRMSQEEAKVTTSKTWYLPHHAVLNPNKPGKVRVVFDAASKFDGVSLNDKLLTGPDLLNNLVGILMRFRTGNIGVMADIEQMFHQVGVCEEDRDSLRFLWRDLDERKRPNEYKMTVHVFGAVDSPCCANYALQRAARDQQGKFREDAIIAVRRNFYMDDLLASKQSSDEAIGLAKDLTEILATGGFRLTKWMSNS